MEENGNLILTRNPGESVMIGDDVEMILASVRGGRISCFFMHLNPGDYVVHRVSKDVGETIDLGDDISIDVLRIIRGQVRLGFKAPKNIVVHRKEIWDRIQEEKENE